MEKQIEATWNVQLAADATDLCQLLAIAFRFPEPALASGLLDGSYLEDVIACLDGLGLARPQTVDTALGSCRGQAQTSEELTRKLRQEYTRLFLSPGNAPLAPFESQFRGQANQGGNKSGFLSNTTLHVEQMYRQTGLAFASDYREPADHVATELEFMMYLYGRLGWNLSREDWEQAETCAQKAVEFYDLHLSRWQRDFMGQVRKLSQESVYAAFADLGLLLADFFALRLERAHERI